MHPTQLPVGQKGDISKPIFTDIKIQEQHSSPMT